MLTQYERPSLQAELVYRLIIEETRTTADRIVERLEALIAHYPSEESLEALREARMWRERSRTHLF